MLLENQLLNIQISRRLLRRVFKLVSIWQVAAQLVAQIPQEKTQNCPFTDFRPITSEGSYGLCRLTGQMKTVLYECQIPIDSVQ